MALLALGAPAVAYHPGRAAGEGFFLLDVAARPLDRTRGMRIVQIGKSSYGKFAMTLPS